MFNIRTSFKVAIENDDVTLEEYRARMLAVTREVAMYWII